MTNAQAKATAREQLALLVAGHPVTIVPPQQRPRASKAAHRIVRMRGQGRRGRR
jgi:hypothetical protein